MIVLLILLLICSGLGIAAFVMSLRGCGKDGFKNCPTSNLYLKHLHNKIKSFEGDICTELPEQEFISSFLNPNDIVLELGGNIGRSSIIATLILSKGNGKLTIIEPGKKDFQILTKNLENYKTIMGDRLTLINKVLSKNPLYLEGWRTSETLTKNSTKIENITFDQLKNFEGEKRLYNVLIIDCEGCIANIIRDYPQILDNVETIILENDSPTEEEYRKLQEMLETRKFYRDFTNKLGQNFNNSKDQDENFFAVYKKSSTNN